MASKKEVKRVRAWKLIAGIILVSLQSLGGWEIEELKYLFQDVDTFSLVLGKTLGFNLLGIIGLIFIIIYIRDVVRFDNLQNDQ